MGIKETDLIDGINYGGVANYIERTDNATMNLFV
ncbi:MAG: DsrE/DsrF/DrsH-like family protein [Bacteroidales bacterium]